MSKKDEQALRYFVTKIDNEMKEFQKRIETFCGQQKKWRHTTKNVGKKVCEEVKRVCGKVDEYLEITKVKLICELLQQADDAIAKSRCQAIVHYEYNYLLQKGVDFQRGQPPAVDTTAKESRLVEYGRELLYSAHSRKKCDVLLANLVTGDTRSKSTRFVSKQFGRFMVMCESKRKNLRKIRDSNSLVEMILAERNNSFGKAKEFPATYVDLNASLDQSYLNLKYSEDLEVLISMFSRKNAQAREVLEVSKFHSLLETFSGKLFSTRCFIALL